MQQITKEQAKQQITMALEIARAIIETVHELHPNPVASGVVYSMLMGHGISLDTYERLVEMAVNSGQIKRGPMHTLIKGDKATN